MIYQDTASKLRPTQTKLTQGQEKAYKIRVHKSTLYAYIMQWKVKWKHLTKKASGTKLGKRPWTWPHRSALSQWPKERNAEEFEWDARHDGIPLVEEDGKHNWRGNKNTTTGRKRMKKITECFSNNAHCQYQSTQTGEEGEQEKRYSTNDGALYGIWQNIHKWFSIRGVNIRVEIEEQNFSLKSSVTYRSQAAS